MAIKRSKTTTKVVRSKVDDVDVIKTVGSSSGSSYNGQFVSNLFLIVMLLFIMFLVAGSLKPSP